MKNLSPQDQIRLIEGNIQLYKFLLVLLVSFYALTLAYELYLEVETIQTRTEIKNPEAVTSR